MKKRVLILGIDGYIGYALATHLLSTTNHEVCGVDNQLRRRMVKEVGSKSLTPITTISERDIDFRNHRRFIGEIGRLDLTDTYNTMRMINDLKPDVIIHLAQHASAPWSMRGPEFAKQAQVENISSNLNILWAMHEHVPKAHLIKIGSMGEYGTPECDIPEGMITECLDKDYQFNQQNNGEAHECPLEGLPFPRSPGSFYHLSKVHDTHNIIFACKTWGLRATDIMQGVVFGLGTDVDRPTRFDYDQYFGTVINRFCAQALANLPLTIYGTGQQLRGFLPLKDSLQCLTIAIDNPPNPGIYRTLNQFENVYQIKALAIIVRECARKLGIEAAYEFLSNPRSESNSHHYKPAHQNLLSLGYKPTKDIINEVYNLLEQLYPYRQNIIPEVIMPTTTWR